MPTDPDNLNDLLILLRREAAAAATAQGVTSPGYVFGYREGWKLAVKMAEERHALTAPDWATPLRELAADLEEQVRRTRTLTDATLSSVNRAGQVDALLHARAAARQALARQIRAEHERAEVVAQARADAPDPVDLSDWTGYPKALPPDAMVEGIHQLALFLGGDLTSFTGDLLRLIAKADPINLNRLVQGFPREVRAFVMWRACAPLDARTLVELLTAANAFGKRVQ
jgi:ABC-type amino acid transport substrate-binding protein